MFIIRENGVHEEEVGNDDQITNEQYVDDPSSWTLESEEESVHRVERQAQYQCPTENGVPGELLTSRSGRGTPKSVQDQNGDCDSHTHQADCCEDSDNPCEIRLSHRFLSVFPDIEDDSGDANNMYDPHDGFGDLVGLLRSHRMEFESMGNPAKR